MVRLGSIIIMSYKILKILLFRVYILKQKKYLNCSLEFEKIDYFHATDQHENGGRKTVPSILDKMIYL